MSAPRIDTPAYRVVISAFIALVPADFPINPDKDAEITGSIFPEVLEHLSVAGDDQKPPRFVFIRLVDADEEVFRNAVAIQIGAQ